MTDIEGRTAFITGGANGIGLGIARALAGAGAKLALVDLDAEALQRAHAELGAITPVFTAVLDVRDRLAYARVADEAEDALEPVSILVNNAGVAAGASIDRLTYELWDWGMEINLGGVINGVQTFLRKMVERGQGGHIVNTASGAGLAATTSGVLYCTAKFGVVGMSECLHAELGSSGIGVSVLCPGPVATSIIRHSENLAPKSDAPLSEGRARRAAERRAKMDSFLQKGVGIDEVGTMVLEAIRNNSLYIHTDRMMADPIAKRSKALLDAMPAG